MLDQVDPWTMLRRRLAVKIMRSVYEYVRLRQATGVDWRWYLEPLNTTDTHHPVITVWLNERATGEPLMKLTFTRAQLLHVSELIERGCDLTWRGTAPMRRRSST